MMHSGDLRALNGLYRAGFHGSHGARIAFFAIRSGKLVGANVDNGIHYTGICAFEFNGRAIIELRPVNRSSEAIELVTGVMLAPGEEYMFTFSGNLRDLGTELTFKTPFGPLRATIELIAPLH